MLLPIHAALASVLALQVATAPRGDCAPRPTAGAAPTTSAARGAVQVVFMEPAGFQTYKVVTDSEKLASYRGWLENECARRALDLYARAAALAPPPRVPDGNGAEDEQRGGDAVKKSEPVAAPAGPPAFYIGLVPGGNHVAGGFRLETDDGVEEHFQTIYIQLAPDAESFRTTLLHETGHIVLALLNGNDGVPRRQLAAIPHTTSALSDRGTAFDEGFAIHLETLAAHLARDPALRARYHGEAYRCGPETDWRRSAYARHAVDLLSYSQTVARYHEVRENNYAFAPACERPDYLRVQLDKARDFATLRDANQLLQCEGFYASFFFALLFRGEGLPDEATLQARQERMLIALRETLATGRAGDMEATAATRRATGADDKGDDGGVADADTPWLPRFVETYMRLYPDESGEVVDVVLDLSHGVFVDAEAAALWREYYEAAVRLDLAGLPKERVQAARERWRAAVLADPKVLYSRLGPQLRCRVPERRVKLVALKRESELSFDLNTVEAGVVRMIPEIAPEEVERWLGERAKAPFRGVDDFDRRAALSPAVRQHLKM